MKNLIKFLVWGGYILIMLPLLARGFKLITFHNPYGLGVITIGFTMGLIGVSLALDLITINLPPEEDID